MWPHPRVTLILWETQTRLPGRQGEGGWAALSGALMLLRPGLEGRWAQAERKDKDGAGRTFWKGSEYFPGLGRKPDLPSFNTCGFPGHTLFLEAVMHIKGAGRQGHTEAPGGQSQSAAHHGRHVSTGDEEQAWGGLSGQGSGSKHGEKQVANVVRGKYTTGQQS